MLILRANRSDNPTNDPFRDFFLQMYETVVTTSTESFIPVIKELLNSSKNKTFQEKALKHENAFRNLGIDVEKCLAKRKIQACTNNSTDLKNTTVMPSSSGQNGTGLILL